MPHRFFRDRHRHGSHHTATLTLLLGMVAFVWTQPATAEPEQSSSKHHAGDVSLDELRAFSDVFGMVRKHYVDEVQAEELLDAALQGMIASLDSHSSYLPPDAFQAQDDGAKGRKGGIGVVPVIDKGRLRVNHVIPDGPAWLAGVRSGDLVLAVDGRKVRGRRLDRSIQALDGPPGTEVTVRFRSDQMPARDLTLQRVSLPARSVRGELLPGGIALLTLDRFTIATTGEFERRLDSLREQAGERLSGLVIDLRNNLGGVIKPAAEIADGFLDEGLVVYTRGRYPASQLEYQALPGQWAPDVPLVVLVNGQSASASEILAGALRDHERALLVGARTYGKGTVQSIVELRNGSALKLTTARYYTPSGKSFDGRGIDPDVFIPAEEKAQSEGDRGADETLEKALELLRKGAVSVGDEAADPLSMSGSQSSFRNQGERAASVEKA
jgi:carboxyl-terminal processing protease